jgi:hypothetical protein
MTKSNALACKEETRENDYLVPRDQGRWRSGELRESEARRALLLGIVYNA